MAEKWDLWFLEFYFYVQYINNKDDIWLGETPTGMLLEERKLKHFKIKKSIMSVQKCKIILLQAALKDFWLSANLKLKKLKGH